MNNTSSANNLSSRRDIYRKFNVWFPKYPGETKPQPGWVPESLPPPKAPFISTPYSPPAKIKHFPSPQETVATEKIMEEEAKREEQAKILKVITEEERKAAIAGPEGPFWIGFREETPVPIQAISPAAAKSTFEYATKYPVETGLAIGRGVALWPFAAGASIVGAARKGKPVEAAGRAAGIGGQLILFYGAGRAVGAAGKRIKPKYKSFVPTEYAKYEEQSLMVWKEKPAVAIKKETFGIEIRDKIIPKKEFKTMVKKGKVKGYTVIKKGKMPKEEYATMPIIAAGKQEILMGDIMSHRVLGFEKLFYPPYEKPAKGTGFRVKGKPSGKEYPFRGYGIEPVSPGASARSKLLAEGRKGGRKVRAASKAKPDTGMGRISSRWGIPIEEVDYGLAFPAAYPKTAGEVSYSKTSFIPAAKTRVSPKISSGITIGLKTRERERDIIGFKPSLKGVTKPGPSISMGILPKPKTAQKVLPSVKQKPIQRKGAGLLPKTKPGLKARPKRGTRPRSGIDLFLSYVPPPNFGFGKPRKRKARKKGKARKRKYRYAPSLGGVLGFVPSARKAPSTSMGLRLRPVVRKHKKKRRRK